MLRRQRQIRSQVQRVADAGLFALSFWLAYLVRSNAGLLGAPVVNALAWLGGTPEIEPFESYLWLFVVVILLSLVLLELQGFYDRPLLASRRQSAWQLLKVCTLIPIGVVIASFFVKVQLARAVIPIFGVASFVLLMAKEELVRRWVLSRMGQAQLRKRLILVGTKEDTGRLLDDRRRRGIQDIDFVAALDVNETSLETLIELLHEHSANGVVLSATHTYFGQIEKVIQACELEGVEVWLMADFFKTRISQTVLDDFYGRPMLVFRSAPDISWQSLTKKAIDLSVSFILLAVGWPLLLLVALIIRLTSPGPVLFRQQRSGLNGRPFTMYKFRSMVTNAEQLKQELAAFNEMEGPVFKVSHDPRVTPFGRFMRKFSIDEAPQLINVLRGEMSLVGPRPLPVDEVKRFSDLAHRRRLSVKPGITCLWQISGRNEIKSFSDWVRLDLEYIDNWSLWLDLKILLRTIPVVLLGTGAK
jgi:exopolysaccharide biosynthesis polyprenyl glycosylphosphotransferase